MNHFGFGARTKKNGQGQMNRLGFVGDNDKGQFSWTKEQIWLCFMLVTSTNENGQG